MFPIKENRDLDALLEDMDTSESEDQSDLEDEEDDIEWLHSEDFQDEMGRKCSNREPVSVDMKPTVTVGNVNISGDASQGAMSALSDGTKRKPLTDKGNTTFEKDQLLLNQNDLDPKSSLFPEAIGDFGDEEEELELDKRLDYCGTAFKKSTLHHPPFSEEDWPLEDISASEHTPRGPHFIQHMKKSYLTHLYVPAQFAAHLPRNNNVELVIRNTDGKSWKIKSIYKKNKQSQSLIFSAGWSKFIQDNDIRVGDVCIIELVGDSELKVLITKVRNPSPAHVNEMPPPPRLYGTRSSGPVATLSPIELVSCHVYHTSKRKEDCLRCSICPKHFCVKSLMNKFQYLEADIPNINLRKWLCPSCQGLCNCKECKGKLTIVDFLAELPSSSSSSSSHALYEELRRCSQPLLAYLNRANTI